MNQYSSIPLTKKILIALPPGLLALLECFHAHGHHNAVYDTLQTQVDRWMIVHYLQLFLFPLTAWSVVQLTKHQSGWLPKLTAAALAIYGIGYASYDSIAGIGTGVLVANSVEMSELANAPEGISAIFGEAIQSYYHSPKVGIIARVSIAAAIVGFVLTAFQLYRQGHGVIPILMLAGACWGVTKTHSPPYGPITYSFVFIAMLTSFFLPTVPRPADGDT